MRETLSDAGDDTRDIADLVDELASELNLLSESRINPDAFFIRRDFLAKRLRRLARRLRKDPDALPATVWRSPSFQARSNKAGEVR